MPKKKKKVVNKDKKVEKTLTDKIEDSLGKDSIVLFDNKDILENYLHLPADLTEENSRELGRYFNTFTKQKMWARTLIGRTRGLVAHYNSKLDSIRVNVYKQLPVRMSIKEKELSLLDNKEACKLTDNVVFYEEKLLMLKNYLENLDDAIFNISREISRRESDWNNEKRENSIDNKRRKR